MFCSLERMQNHSAAPRVQCSFYFCEQLLWKSLQTKLTSESVEVIRVAEDYFAFSSF